LRSAIRAHRATHRGEPVPIPFRSKVVRDVLGGSADQSEQAPARRYTMRRPRNLVFPFLVAAGLTACAFGDEAPPEKSEVLFGKADGVDLCRKFGFPAGCDVCAEFEWYGDGECDKDLYESGVCALPDEQDCASLGPTGFRLTDAELADPPVWADFGGDQCGDVTTVVNTLLRDQIRKDADGDGLLDLSILNLFHPLDPASPAGMIEVGPGACAAPAPGSSCALDQAAATSTTVTQKTAGTCLGPLAGTTTPGATVSTATAPCYATASMDFRLSLGPINVVLADARLGGSFAGAPIGRLDNGLARGFISEAQAEALILPADLPLVGGKQLSNLLPGGAGSCAAIDGRDVGPDGTTRGWYFYLNFTAQVVDLAVP
jgi:hypothetical protein